jgi:hypothetical protein
MPKYQKPKKLLSYNNFKIKKAIKKGYETAILHLAPYKLSGLNVCPKASKGCIASCLNTSGMGAFSTTQNSRINRTKYFRYDRQKFLEQLDYEIKLGVKRANNKGLKFARDNKNLMELNPSVPFYDYTKNYFRFKNKIPKNYHITFSKSESNDDIVNDLINDKKINIAVVFKKLPKKYLGRKVIDGDETDLRFLDPKNSIVGLIAKGKARYDQSGFVV